ICPYCDFAVLVGGEAKRHRFVDALLREIALYAANDFAPVDTIYFGGGTPSLLEVEDLARILDSVRSTFAPLPDTRITLEANPEDIDPGRLADWRQLGVGTLSLGIQSFDDAELRFLGRRHDAAAATKSLELSLAAGFDTVSVDLIYGLPQQTEAALRRNLAHIAKLQPQHLSGYELEIHPRTTFGKCHQRGDLQELSESRQAALFRLTHEVLSGAGYMAYEVSNFASDPQHRSRHNRKYWRHVPYLGLGPSAHSFDGQRRWWNERLLPHWQRALKEGRKPLAGHETLRRRDLALEALMLGLRTTEGVDLERVEALGGVDLERHNRRLIERSIRCGFLRREESFLRPTVEGLAVADGLAAEFELADQSPLGSIGAPHSVTRD
ncbi:MAG: radical SAM family heme chaperone HemW, partial [Acidobacteriota bacterium]